MTYHPGDVRYPILAQYSFADAASANAQLVREFAALSDHPRVHRTHAFHGRFENTYVPADLIPALAPISDWILAQAQSVLGTSRLHWGCWFNEMGPGHRTSLHHHDEDDELLSAVYYVRVPADSGRLVLWDDSRDTRIQPVEGMLVMFSPQVPHEVEENRSADTRLSVAFNFGPPRDED